MSDAEFDVSQFDLDSSVNQAWADFQRRLADHLASMQRGDLLILESGFEEIDPERPMPYIQYLVWDADMVRCEVPSNHVLHPSRALSDSDQQYLTQLGWLPPTNGSEIDGEGSPSFYVDKSQSWADQLAAMSVAAFRDVWGVAHPAFLDSVESGSEEVPSFEVSTAAASLVPDLSPTAPVTPHGAAHLKELVARTLVSVLGVVPQQDPDGDIPVRVGQTIMFVGPLADSLDVQLFAPLVDNISNRTRAAELVADLNRTWSRIKFVLIDDRLSAFMEVPADPFVPKHLTDMCRMFSEFLRTVDESFPKKFGGDPFFGPTGTEFAPDVDLTSESIPTELLTLFHLDPKGEGDLDVSVVAQVCGNDRHRILKLLNLAHQWQSQLQQSSKLAAEDEDLSMRDAFEAQAVSWRSIMDLLRDALRTVVLNPEDESPDPGPQDENSHNEPTLFDEQ